MSRSISFRTRVLVGALTTLLTTLLTMSLAACGGGGGDQSTPVEPPPTPVPTSLSVSGDAQQADAGTAVAVAPSVTVRDAAGRPMAGVTVTFTVTSGGGNLEGATPTTNAAGVAAVSRWVLGASGAQRLTASVASLAPATIRATITPGTEFFTARIGPSGGPITIDDSAHIYRGFTIDIPGGTYDTPSEWRVQVGTLSNSFTTPAGFRVLGPPLDITTDALRGAQLMTLDVPVSAAPDAPVFIALHDPVRGVSELLPTIARSATTVTVATGHVRGDLLQGSITPESAARARANDAAGPAQLTLPAPTQVIPLLLDQLGAVQATVNRWPVTDHGTAAHPDGVGLGIAVLQQMAAFSSLPPFESFVRRLSIPGFYAEPGPLAVAQLSQERIQSEVKAAIANLGAVMDRQPAEVRDQLIAQNILASMRFSTRPALIGFLADGSDRPGAFAVTSASLSGLTLVNPASAQPAQVTIDGGRFGTITVPLIGGAAPRPVRRMVPITSAVMSMSKLQTLLDDLGRLSGALSPEAREAINTSLAREAGLAAMQAQIRHATTSAWINQLVGRLVARRTTAQLRILGHRFTLHLPDGAELARSTGEPLSVVDDADVGTDPSAGEALRTIATYIEGVNGALQQVSVAVAKLKYAPFEVGPEETLLSAQDRTVELEASVPLPPEDGYRIEWSWGDGTTTEQLGLPTASHTYQQPGDFEVVARLLSTADRSELAVDTVQVREKPSMWVGSVTATITNTTPNYSNTVHLSATGVRFERAPESGTETVRYNLTAGALTVYNDVPCAGYVSPTVQVNLATVTRPQWILTSTRDPNAPADTASARGLWFAAHGSADGFQLYNKVCPTDQNPEPEAYVYARGLAWLFTYPSNAPATGWRRAVDPDVLEGTFSRPDGTNVTQTWTWRFERVDAP